jgi:peroxiredoxin
MGSRRSLGPLEKGTFFMGRFVIALVIGSILGWVAPSRGGEFNPRLNIGDSAPSWTNLPGIDGRTHSLADLQDKEVVVVVFTCNDCPMAVAYEDRIIGFVKKHAGAGSKVALVAMCVNQEEADRLPELKQHAEEKGFNFPYLRDDSQCIGRAYGASITPEFFVLDKNRKVVYMGAMDDKLNHPRVNHLESAVAAVLKGGKPGTVETAAQGCTIRYAKKRK